MKVQLGDREVWIEFAYLQVPVFGAPRGEARHQEATQCSLRDGSAPRGKNEPAPLLVRGEVVRYYKDPPNREVARKAALTKALEILDQVMPVAVPDRGEICLGMSAARWAKARRELFWHAYLNRSEALAYSNVSRAFDKAAKKAAMQSRVLPAKSNEAT